MSAAIPRAEWWVRLSWFWLVLLAPLLVFSNGRWQLAIAALASPFFARLFLFSLRNMHIRNSLHFEIAICT